mgnify:CR=1 FL=1
MAREFDDAEKILVQHTLTQLRDQTSTLEKNLEKSQQDVKQLRLQISRLENILKSGISPPTDSAVGRTTSGGAFHNASFVEQQREYVIFVLASSFSMLRCVPLIATCSFFFIHFH